MEKTYVTKPGEVAGEWYVVDAAGQTLGRLASEVARVLIGKHRPQYSPSAETGDYVVVINAEKVHVTGRKMDQKMYHNFSGYPGGLRSVTLRDQLGKFPDRVIRHAVRGMIPKNRLGERLFSHLKVYAGPDHPHGAQQPKALDLG